MPSNPYTPPETDEQAHSASRSRLTSIVLLLVSAFFVMIPWPVIAVALGEKLQMFESNVDYAFLFGGVTLFFLLPLLIIVEIPDTATGVIMVIIWWLILVLPPTLLAVRRVGKPARTVMLLVQSGISLTQAAMGFLMILGRSV